MMMVRFDQVPGKAVEKVRGGAYYRCFGNEELAHLLSRVQSLIIRYGTELEKMVLRYTEDRQIDDLDDFLSRQIMGRGVLLASKAVIKRAETVQGYGIEPDFMIFKREGNTQSCYLVELKDGHEFDTKSSAKEHANLRQFLSKNADALKWFEAYGRVVGFNAETQEEIWVGFKKKISLEQAMTGRQFCELLEIDYDQMAATRAEDRARNFNSFIDDLAGIEQVREALKSRLGV